MGHPPDIDTHAARPPLFDTLTQQVKMRADEILAAACVQAEEIRKAALDMAEARRVESMEALHKEREALTQAAREQAYVEAERLRTAEQYKAVDEVLSALKRRLEALAEESDFESILLALLQEALEAFDRDASPGCNVIILIPPQFSDVCREWVRIHGARALHGRPAEVQAEPRLLDGVAVQDHACAVRVTNTLGERFAMLEPELRKRCVLALFGQEA